MSQSSTGTYQRHSKLLTVASSGPRLCKSFISVTILHRDENRKVMCFLG